jgi:NAD kinase
MLERLTENKIVLIVRRTRLDELVARFNTRDQARFYVEHLGADFADYEEEDRVYKASVREAEQVLERLGRVQRVDRTFVPNFVFGPGDLVLALGQDGLVANVLKYLDRQLLLGVNPDPARWEGVLLPFAVGDLRAAVARVFAGEHAVRRVTMAQATLNTGQTLYGVNDLFIGPRTHTSARYLIQTGDRSEQQSSSGIIVSTGLGSTGWLRSILAGATGIAASLAGSPESPPSAGSPPASEPMDWDADYLYFSVREPWPSTTSAAEITFGRVTAAAPLTLVSHMPEHGVIFSDGIEADFLQFNAGTQARITLADKYGNLVAG